jgi:hypothetical protein
MLKLVVKRSKGMNKDLFKIWEPKGPIIVGNMDQYAQCVRNFLEPRSNERNRGLFRGVPKSDWKLIPSLPRSRDRENKEWLTPEMLCEIEDNSLEQFKLRARLYLEEKFFPCNDDKRSWYALLQHYGGKTRLLDWSASAYVACYFAAVKEPDADGAVWMVEHGAHEDRMLQYYGAQFEDGKRKMPLVSYKEIQLAENDPKKMEELRRQLKANFEQDSTALKVSLASSLEFFPCSIPTDRMSAQRGWFSCASLVDVNHGEAIALAFSAPEWRDRNWCQRIIIKKEAKSQLLRDLWHMNITGETVYGGLDGLGRAMGEMTDLLVPDHRIFHLANGLLTQQLK